MISKSQLVILLISLVLALARGAALKDVDVAKCRSNLDNNYEFYEMYCSGGKIRYAKKYVRDSSTFCKFDACKDLRKGYTYDRAYRCIVHYDEYFDEELPNEIVSCIKRKNHSDKEIICSMTEKEYRGHIKFSC